MNMSDQILRLENERILEEINTRIKFATEFRKLLKCMDDPYIKANLEKALAGYENAEDLKEKPPVRYDFKKCVHGVAMHAFCETCYINYGEGRPPMRMEYRK